ncbi:MAG: hypothetical protein H6831_13955 [Planctomycetes bacterium]|nr:hypothetical protein [Planctomycetota bacterium]MCB9905504.1 hypothetical protein [Planctomycetota bacterium]
MNLPPKAALEPIRSHSELHSAIQSLRHSLRVIDRGVEPDLGLHLAEIARIADFGRLRMPGALPLYCRELETRLWELACCDLPASIEDYDVFLQLLARIELAAHEGAELGAPLTAEPLPSERKAKAPRRRLSARPERGGFALCVPDSTNTAELDQLLEDLTVLWEITPRSAVWSIDCSRLRRVPLALLAHLIDLRLQDGAKPRRMRISGLEQCARSSELTALLREHFEQVAG